MKNIYFKYSIFENGMIKEKQQIASVIVKNDFKVTAEFTNTKGEREVRDFAEGQYFERPILLDF